jgi:hypothetical protein
MACFFNEAREENFLKHYKKAIAYTVAAGDSLFLISAPWISASFSELGATSTEI